MNACNECGNFLQTGWVACPFCGVHIDNVFNSSMPLVELAARQCKTNCSGSCSKSKSKKLKSKCCKKYERKNKHCKTCPEHPQSVDSFRRKCALG